MSVPKSLRSEGKLRVITKANELAAYTIKICSNENCFPKRYRWCLTSKMLYKITQIPMKLLTFYIKFGYFV